MNDTTRMVPKVGVERMAATLINFRNAEKYMYDNDIRPQYRAAIATEQFNAAAEMLHDAGYGSTPNAIKALVSTYAATKACPTSVLQLG